jgi:CHAT domain-containing protein/tetratricopeptide (TPR) repeat protein
MPRNIGIFGAAKAIAVALFLVSADHAAVAASAIDTLAAQMGQAGASGQFADGLVLAQKLEALVRRQQGSATMNYAGVLHNEGMFLHNLGRYPEAAEKLNAALAIKLRNNDAASTLRTSSILCASLLMLQRQAEAAAVAQRALAIGTQAFGSDDPRLAGPLESLGALAREQENYRDAAGYFERALAVQQKSPVPSPWEIAGAMDDLGDVYGLEGRFDDGERLLQQALKLLEQSYAADLQNAPNYPKVLNDLGNLYNDAGRYPEAEAVFVRALNVERAKVGNDHPNVAATMGNLATMLNGASRFAEAEALYKQTLAIYEKVFGPNDAITAIGLNNLANNYMDQGRVADAMGLQQRALAIDEKVFGPDSTDAARNLNNLGNSYKALGRADESGPLFERSLKILTQKFGDGAPQITLALSNLARLAQNSGRLDEAEEKFNRVLVIDEKTYGPDHPALVDDLRSLAFVDSQRSNYPQARARLERALLIAQARLGPRHRTTLYTMVNLADVISRQGQWADALAMLRRAAVANSGRGAGGPALAHFYDLDSALVEAIWHVAAGHPDDAASDEAFQAAQRAHETQAAAALTQMAARFGAGSDAVASAVRRQQDLKATLEGLDKRITTELGAPNGKRNDALISGLRAETARAQGAFDEISARIARDFPGYVELSSPSPLSIAQTQALLKPDEALVSYLIMNQRSFVFAITREASGWQLMSLNTAALDARITQLRAGLFNAAPDAAGPAPFDLDASHELYAALLGPVEAVIAKKPKLLVVPSGALTSLPFQVLVTQKPDPVIAPADRYRKAAWLLNDKATTVLPSVPSLRALRSLAKTSRATRPFIGFGDPLLQRAGSAEKKTAPRSLQPYQSYYNGTSVDLDTLRRGLPGLPETGDELRAVAHELGAPDGDVRLGAAATVTSVKAAGLEQYRVVDFATHGLVAGEVGGLSEPALVMSLPDHPTADDDGLLTASRVAKLTLDADWAVLSACNTAAGDKPGAEGLSGLARAFFYAGARSLLVSHWPVESEAAVRLTTSAFAELAKNPDIGRAEALRRSMQKMIADRSSARNAEPTVWAPFVLVGEGG